MKKEYYIRTIGPSSIVYKFLRMDGPFVDCERMGDQYLFHCQIRKSNGSIVPPLYFFDHKIIIG